MFLVTVEDEGSGKGKGEEVTISVTNPVGVQSQTIKPGQVAEVILIPDEESKGKTITVTIFGERNEVEHTATVTVEVIESEFSYEYYDELAPYAQEMRDRFIPWIATNYPELGITSETEWTRTVIKPGIVVVMYYLFFSEEWEMGVTWHVTRVPDDWTRIYLRRRNSEMKPSYGFEISSQKTEGDEPHVVDLKDLKYFMTEVWR